MREAPSLVLIDLLIKAGCMVNVYDPVSMDECKSRLDHAITYCNDMYEAAIDADAFKMKVRTLYGHRT